MNMKKKILFIVNNLSGTVSQYNIPKCIDMFLDLDTYEPSTFLIDETTSNESYIERLNEKWDVIASVGGDGTLLELGQWIIPKNIPLAIIPIGSGNGIATHIGYKPRDVRGAFEAINQGKIKPIDVGQINGKYFFSNFGMGIDAKVAKDFKIKKNRSFLVYSYLTLKRILKLKPKKIIYKVNERTHEVHTYLFNVFNSNLYGYNVGILPWASAFDGELDVVYLKSTGFWKLPWAAFCILMKRPDWTSSIVYFKTTSISIINFKLKKMGYQIDGDPKKSERTDIEINVLPAKLNIIVP